MNLRQELWLLLLIPICILGYFSLRRQGKLPFSPTGRIVKAGRTWRVWLWWLPELVTVLLFCLWAILIAGPERTLDPEDDEGNGLSIAIAIDRSGSMAAQIPYEGSTVSRLEGVKAVTKDFLNHRGDDQFALLSFARYPETHTPLCSNREILADFLALLAPPTNKDEDGTAIGEALALATARLAKTPAAKSKVIILLTDGQNNAGEKSPDDGANLAKAQGITVYTIGLGGPGVMIVDTPNGPQAMNMRVDLDERTLKSIAEKTGGRFYRANSLGDLSAFYQDIAGRETAKLNLKRDRTAELNLMPGLIVLLALILFRPVLSGLILRRGDL